MKRNIQDDFSIKRIGFFILPSFSLIAYASAIETLRLANQLANKELYVWNNLTPNNEEVRASNGIKIESHHFVKDMNEYDLILVCGGENISDEWSESIGEYLHTLAEQNIALGSLCTGAYILAKAGLLDGYRFTLHWEDIPLIRKEFPHLSVTDDVYEIDNNRFTCAGGTTPIDMFHHIISKQHGRKLAGEISETILIDYVRGMSERQKIPIIQKIGKSQPVLFEIVSLMEMNLEFPLSTREIANLLNISRRHIERLFRLYLSMPPTRYYLGLRLRYARRLLMQSDSSVTEIAEKCGFTTPAHFSQSYRKVYGISPNKERRSLMQE